MLSSRSTLFLFARDDVHTALLWRHSGFWPLSRIVHSVVAMVAVNSAYLAAVVLVFSLLTGQAVVVRAQELPSVVAPPPPPGVSATLDSARALRGASLEVSLYTYGHSAVFYERFGHTALGIRDHASGRDEAFNWGVYDFDDPTFLVNFLTGDARYWVEIAPTAALNQSMVAHNRSVRQQVLALTPTERAAILEYVRWNADAANRYYRYDYYRDNCSTRVRDLLDRTLQGRLRRALSSAENRTWRGETARAYAYELPFYLGIQIALGQRADQRLSQWEQAFLPERLAAIVATAFLPSDLGSRPFISRDTILYASSRPALPAEAPSWAPPAVLIGVVMAALYLALSSAEGVVARVTLSVLCALWLTLGGLVGTALLLAATLTRHVTAMGANTTLLTLHPGLLIAALPVARAAWRQRSSRSAAILMLLVTALSDVALLGLVLPGRQQSNGVVLAVVLPVHTVLALLMWRWYWASIPTLGERRRVVDAA